MGALRILCLTTSYPLDVESSSGVFVAHLAEALGKSNEVTVLTPAYQGLSGNDSGPVSVQTFRYGPAAWQRLCHAPGGIPAALRTAPWLGLLVPALLAAMLLATIRRARQCDVIQANWAVCGAVAVVAALFLRRCSVVTTLRGDDVNTANRSFINRQFLKIAIWGSATVVTVSDGLKQQLIQHLGVMPEKISVVPNGVADSFLQVGVSRTADVDRDPLSPLSLITIGSLIPRKNVGFLLSALSELPPKCRLTVVGDGQLETELHQQARALGIDERVDFKGSVSPAHVPALLASHDIFALASFSEGRSNAIYEAMAAALCVVASDIPGTREQIDNNDNGYLFDLNGTASFVAMVSRLNADRSMLIASGRRAHQWVVENNLSWEATADTYATLLTVDSPSNG